MYLICGIVKLENSCCIHLRGLALAYWPAYAISLKIYVKSNGFSNLVL